MSFNLKPHIYMLHGQWRCARWARGAKVWTIYPYGYGFTPVDAYVDWVTRCNWAALRDIR